MSDDEVPPSVSQIDCKGLSQFLATMLAELPVSSDASEGSTLLTTDGKNQGREIEVDTCGKF